MGGVCSVCVCVCGRGGGGGRMGKSLLTVKCQEKKEDTDIS